MKSASIRATPTFKYSQHTFYRNSFFLPFLYPSSFVLDCNWNIRGNAKCNCAIALCEGKKKENTKSKWWFYGRFNGNDVVVLVRLFIVCILLCHQFIWHFNIFDSRIWLTMCEWKLIYVIIYCECWSLQSDHWISNQNLLR